MCCCCGFMLLAKFFFSAFKTWSSISAKLVERSKWFVFLHQAVMAVLFIRTLVDIGIFLLGVFFSEGYFKKRGNPSGKLPHSLVHHRFARRPTSIARPMTILQDRLLLSSADTDPAASRSLWKNTSNESPIKRNPSSVQILLKTL